MTNYRRIYTPGAAWFFTVNLLERYDNPLLLENIETLRSAFRYVKERHPFNIEAIVILPDHLHCIWTLPENDFNRHLDYIHWNPVKHGYVFHVADWSYSSFQQYVKMGWYPET